ncbi:MAG TPA: NAD-dependent epimerase/dehydratase family protein [Devosiaceae bacterium]|jgi:nucleoside-diphosphate-sugar epimerase|nr:NAD-dependent epimerase/dehydratase family protein [Devosiaceae bacterium]
MVSEGRTEMEPERMRVLVTGVTGFVGSALARHLIATGTSEVVAPVRRPTQLDGITAPLVEGIGPATDWGSVLAGVDAIVHCAGRAHQVADRAADPLAAFRSVNTAGTLRLAEAAVGAGVRRLVFVSTVKVHGAENGEGQPISEADRPAPADPYAISKWEAEQGLRNLAARSGLEVVVVRPPLVYGPNPKGNLLRLLRLVERGIPLPFGAVRNRRSMIGIDNFVSALSTMVAHPAAGGRTYLVSDGEDVSTPDLIRLMAAAMGKPARLLPVPPMLLRLAGKAAGRGEDVDRLLGSLEVNSSRLVQDLGWAPVRSLEAGITDVANRFLHR